MKKLSVLFAAVMMFVTVGVANAQKVASIDYEAISGIAKEAKANLKAVQPLSIAQASRISGVNPADISILLVYIEQGKIAKVSG